MFYTRRSRKAVWRRRASTRTSGPQYVAFILVMAGFLLQWPTILTLLMFPVLAWMYVRLARAEEREVLEAFGQQYEAYRNRTPGFLPRIRVSTMFRSRPAEAAERRRKP
ncbi:exported protein of unknown function (plasmid) [Cupriavidus taiwanensis]|uniref:Isoprenylcysteine carboxylmethyltransferase family protein n=1 Tax=Cupriavidus taiwanensis TaxID=164546 RepID=A0A375I7D8_9BURK|nr:exported hypothetical protein [Cupriavidus taiwanensis]SPK77068.1 exported protein of unknown function [Cupriavidus taiwanensis]